MSIRIEPARAEDTGSIRALVRHVVARTFDEPAMREDVEGNVEQNMARWLADPPSCIHLKAVDGELIVGMVLLREYWNLCNLFVDPAWQKQGVGRALVEAACAPCAGRSPRGAILLNAAPNAIAFYRRLGFTERPPTRPLPPGVLPMQRGA